jgi:hypothetical protein
MLVDLYQQAQVAFREFLDLARYVRWGSRCDVFRAKRDRGSTGPAG